MSLDRLPKTCTACGAPGRWVWSESSAEWFFERTADSASPAHALCGCDIFAPQFTADDMCKRCNHAVELHEVRLTDDVEEVPCRASMRLKADDTEPPAKMED